MSRRWSASRMVNVIAFAPIAGFPALRRSNERAGPPGRAQREEYRRLSHPLVALANDKAVRQAAEFRDAAALWSKERLAETYAAERAAAPALHRPARPDLGHRSRQPPAE